MDKLIKRLDALAAKAAATPWTIQDFKGATEYGRPIECDYQSLADEKHEPIALDYYETAESQLAISLVNAWPQLRDQVLAAIELEKDARRYCYLRDAPNDFPHPFIAIRSPINVVNQVRNDTADFAVDQAIDAALNDTK